MVGQFIGQPQAWSPTLVVTPNVGGARNTSQVRQKNLTRAGAKIRKPAFDIRLIRAEVVPANAVIESELGRHPPNILPVECVAPLPLVRNEPEDSTLKVGGQAEHEAGSSDS